MRLSSGWAAACALTAIAIAGCTTERTTPDAGGPTDSGAGGMDAGLDAGMRRCTVDTECDDAIACTADSCAVGNVCRNTPLDELCSGEERCVVGVGCRMGLPSECETADQCDDGDFCNGVEDCVGPAGSRVCVMGTAADCDDGNTCTVDTCDSSPAINGCRYDIAAGCDAGAVGFDGGTVCDPFEPSDYVGTFTFRPSAISACTMSASFNISEIVVSMPGTGLSVRADRFTLTQAVAPTDGSFDVSFSDSCGTYRLVGAFACADSWSGTWTATFSGSCASLCSNQTRTVRGSRR